ncbi:uncharacterized protein ATNIH1004_004909 [Aspergillus tanneri]|uniref:Alcohol dehydrogenase-like C-terminal domain-containing protein n=1 Tax=Aspergillus tanneri TaxID=1220188 RepID=A0A5M9MQ47_9EURO|nr:uncharacterized protein ATNIH1004_004909 [Aspergillus tanneri]KAA8649018.1 hypothetical protein ATNIH1004_004909 [Aspergillus tanneri]
MQFANAAGATVIATTSSDEKAKKLKELGAEHVINYKSGANWGEIAHMLTPGNSFKCIKFEGVITIIGSAPLDDVSCDG